MKNSQIFLFFAIVLTIYSLINAYLFFKGYQLMISRQNRLIYSAVFILLALTFVAGKILESRFSSVFSDILNITGGFWMGFMLYAFLLFLLSDIISLAVRASGILNNDNIINYRKWSAFIIMAISFLLITGGFINAVLPRVKHYTININKPADGIKTMKVAAVSDIHLGSIIRKRSMKKLSAILKEIKPELVFLLGDIVDGELGPVLRGDLLKYFHSPETPFGLYAITGNHEYIGGAGRTIPYIENKGIHVLKDEIVQLSGGIQLIGRLDRDSFRYNGKERLSLESLMKDIDRSRPIILLDHQPFNLSEAERNGVDLQLSGHTHNGQIWPLNYLTKKIYEVSYGYLRKNNLQVIVSSGFGLWGPRIRSGSRSEILVVDITFSGQGAK